MSKFPGALTPLELINVNRAERLRDLMRSGKIGIGIRIAIILFELVGVVLINSSALFMDVLSSSMDVLSTVFLLICIKLAQRPPDENHPLGHGRYEPLGGFLLGLTMVILGIFMFVQQLMGAFDRPYDHVIHPLGWLFPFVAVILLEVCYRKMIGIAKKRESPALAADAIHYRVDGLTSLFAMLALLISAYLPAWSHLTDHIGALFIALFMVVVGLIAAKENFNQIMDRVPGAEFFDRVRSSAMKVEGVSGTEKIRIQMYGPDAHVNIDVEVDPTMNVEEAHGLSQLVRYEIQKDWPAVRDVIVHIEPYFPNDH